MVSKTRKSFIASVCALVVVAGSVALGTSAASAGGAEDLETASPSVAASGMPELIQINLNLADPAPAERKVLERSIQSGSIAAGDYENSHRTYTKCMTSNGFTPSFRKSPDGFYVELPYLKVSDFDALDAAVVRCSKDTKVLTSLYQVQKANPNLIKDSRLVAIRCLNGKGAVSAEYTVDDFEREWSTSTFSFDANETKNNDCLYGAGYAFFAMED